MSDLYNVSDALVRLGDAAKRAGQALLDTMQALADVYVEMWKNVVAYLPDAIDDAAALAQAPPRVRHLALHGKKRKTRKKNLNRTRKLYHRANR